MGVYIKGMEMPSNEPMLVKINPDGSVSTTAKNGYKKYEAISVPEPYGRLIDADALREEVKKHTAPSDAWVFSLIRTAPTIITASEEGET